MLSVLSGAAVPFAIGAVVVAAGGSATTRELAAAVGVGSAMAGALAAAAGVESATAGVLAVAGGQLSEIIFTPVTTTLLSEEPELVEAFVL
jgi:hypothetical protein